MPIIDLSNPSSGLLFCLFMLIIMAWSMWCGMENDPDVEFFQHVPPVLIFLGFVAGVICYLCQLVSIGFGHSVP